MKVDKLLSLCILATVQFKLSRIYVLIETLLYINKSESEFLISFPEKKYTAFWKIGAVNLIIILFFIKDDDVFLKFSRTSQIFD